MPNLPKPFSRPAISLGTEEKKEWQSVAVETLSHGDVVVDKGRVERVTSDVGVTIVSWANGNASTYDSDTTVMAFTRVR